MQDFVAVDATVFASRAPVEDKTAVGIAGCGVSLRVLPPIGVIVPNAKCSRQVVCFDGRKKSVQAMLRRHIPTEKHCNADNPAQQEDTDQQGPALPCTASVMDWCVEKCHRASSLFESEILIFSDTEKVGNVPVLLSATAR